MAFFCCSVDFLHDIICYAKSNIHRQKGCFCTCCAHTSWIYIYKKNDDDDRIMATVIISKNMFIDSKFSPVLCSSEKIKFNDGNYMGDSVRCNRPTIWIDPKLILRLKNIIYGYSLVQTKKNGRKNTFIQ